jgi:hypothetical protein
MYVVFSVSYALVHACMLLSSMAPRACVFVYPFPLLFLVSLCVVPVFRCSLYCVSLLFHFISCFVSLYCVPLYFLFRIRFVVCIVAIESNSCKDGRVRLWALVARAGSCPPALADGGRRSAAAVPPDPDSRSGHLLHAGRAWRTVRSHSHRLLKGVIQTEAAAAAVTLRPMPLRQVQRACRTRAHHHGKDRRGQTRRITLGHLQSNR